MWNGVKSVTSGPLQFNDIVDNVKDFDEICPIHYRCKIYYLSIVFCYMSQVPVKLPLQSILYAVKPTYFSPGIQMSYSIWDPKWGRIEDNIGQNSIFFLNKYIGFAYSPGSQGTKVRSQILLKRRRFVIWLVGSSYTSTWTSICCESCIKKPTFWV